MAIGVFDSGVGGLTVLRALHEALPQTHFIYLGDTARLPYGSKSPQTIRRYLEQNVAFLSRQPLDAIVVACNSAASVLEPGESFGVPVFEVIGPGARAACEVSARGHIGVLGTRATVTGGGYLRRIMALRPDARVVQQACPLFVPLVEEGLQDHALAETAARMYLEPLLAAGVDTLILGCTHYPALRDVLARVAGPEVVLVDSATVLARELRGFVTGAQPGLGGPRVRAYFTDLSPAMLEVARRLFAAEEFAAVETVDL